MDLQDIASGRRIAELRKSRGFSREYLAELSDISVQFLADIEKGRKTMTITTLRRICRALSVTTDYIVNADVESNCLDEIWAMVMSLPEKEQIYARQLLEVYIRALRESHENV